MPDIFLRDSEWGTIGNPEHPEHDTNGFRNGIEARDAEVFIVGDSWMHGYGVTAGESVQGLLNAAGIAAHGASSNAWSLWQYCLASTRFMPRHVRTCVVALYLGNDFGAVLADFHASSAPEKAVFADAGLGALPPTLHNGHGHTDRSVRRFLATHGCDAVGALRLCARDPAIDLEIASYGNHEYFVVPRQRRDLVNRVGQDMASTWDMSEALIRAMIDLCDAHGIDPIFVFLPSKEALLGALTAAEAEAQSLLHAVYRAETDLEQAFRDLLDDIGVTHAECRSALLENFTDAFDALRWDGHPNAFGYRVIADRLRTVIERSLETFDSNSYPFM